VPPVVSLRASVLTPADNHVKASTMRSLPRDLRTRSGFSGGAKWRRQP
jgi:hypothetical protein